MKKLAVLLIPVIAGCQSIQSFELEQAMNSNDVSAAQNVYLSKDSSYPIKTKALSYLSNQYAAELFTKGDDSLITEGALNDLCVARIGHACNQDALAAFQREGDRRRSERQERINDAIAKGKAFQEERSRIISEISSGKRKITSIKEARAYFDPIQSSNELMIRPKVSGGDGKYYEIQTYLTGQEGGTLVSWWPDSPYSSPGILAGAVFPSPAYVQDGLAFGGPVSVVGKYVANREVTLVTGKRVLVPVFSGSYIFGP